MLVVSVLILLPRLDSDLTMDISKSRQMLRRCKGIKKSN